MIDGDIIVYRCGFAVKEHEPTAYALQNVKSVLSDILDRFPQRKASKLYLSGGTNFREQLATIKQYKANRTKARPRDYDAIREYMINQWEAIVTEGEEADDAIGIEQFKNKEKDTCIVTIDKDLNMIPGWHFNWLKNSVSYIDIHNANINLFRQMLEGDTSDNIPGVVGCGEAGAQELIDSCHGDLVLLREKVKDLYRRQYSSADPAGWLKRKDWQKNVHELRKAGLDGDTAYEEVAGLLWIRRKENEICPLI